MWRRAKGRGQRQATTFKQCCKDNYVKVNNIINNKTKKTPKREREQECENKRRSARPHFHSKGQTRERERAHPFTLKVKRERAGYTHSLSASRRVNEQACESMSEWVCTPRECEWMTHSHKRRERESDVALVAATSSDATAKQCSGVGCAAFWKFMRCLVVFLLLLSCFCCCGFHCLYVRLSLCVCVCECE